MQRWTDRNLDISLEISFFLTHKGTLGSHDYNRPVSYDDDLGKDMTAFLQIYPKLDVPELNFYLHSATQSTVSLSKTLCVTLT